MLPNMLASCIPERPGRDAAHGEIDVLGRGPAA